MEDLKNKIEAVLFTVGKKIDLEEIAKLCRVGPKDIKKVLNQLKNEYEQRNGALSIFEEGSKWSLTARERYISLTRRIVADTELSKTMMETLAVIAWKQPIRQSDVIAIRTNKAYDHIHDLKEMGFISSEKSGRTRLLKLTDKFFKYFEVSGDTDIRELFDKKLKPLKTKEEPEEQKQSETEEEKPNEEYQSEESGSEPKKEQETTEQSEESEEVQKEEIIEEQEEEKSEDILEEPEKKG